METEARFRAFQQLHGLSAQGAVDPTTGGVLALAATVAIASDKDKLQVGFCASVYESEMHWGECARVYVDVRALPSTYRCAF